MSDQIFNVIPSFPLFGGSSAPNFVVMEASFLTKKIIWQTELGERGFLPCHTPAITPLIMLPLPKKNTEKHRIQPLI